MTTLGDVVSPSKGKLEPSDRPDSPYLSLEHIEPETGRITGCGRGGDVCSTKAIFRAGDVLYGKLRPYLNKVCMPDFGGICSTDVLVFPKSPLLESRYLLRFLMQQSVVKYAHHHSAGVQLPRVSFAKLADIEFPLPPLAEQRRIVAQMETLLTRIQAARARLAKVPVLLKRFRQSVLAAACSGQLTEDWRETNLDGEPPCETLLRVAEHKSHWLKANPSKRSRHNARNEAIADAGGIELFVLENDVPESWCWTRIGDLFEVKYGLSEPLRNTSPQTPSDLPVISMANITPDGRLNLSGIRYFDVPTGDRPKLLLRRGDLLFNWRNAPNWIGKTAIFDLRGDYVNASFLLRLRPYSRDGYGRFVWMLLNFLRLAGYFAFTSRAAVSQSNFNATETAAIRFPLPPLQEQEEIVRRVDALFALADKIEARVRTATTRVEKTTQAILAKAFRGELVPTEAELARAKGHDYEPASVLLERIRTERGAASGESGTKSRRVSRAKSDKTKDPQR